MYPWRRILIPTDFSTASAWAFDDAVRIAGPAGAELLVLHVRMTWSSHPAELRLPADEALFAYVENIELEKLRDRARQMNAAVPIRLLVRTAPDPGPEILRSSDEEEADLVVMATHARHHVAHVIVGSTTLDVIARTSVPLLAVRYGVHLRQGMRRITVPVHASQTSRAALRLAAEVARREEGEVRVVTVCTSADREAADAVVRELASTELAGLPSSTAVLESPAICRAIVKDLHASSADALFVNAADDTSVLKEELIRNAPVPVMIVAG